MNMSFSEQNIRSVKRRRLDEEETEDNKKAKLRRKLHHALKDLRKVVKKARAFEVQKTLKKLKEARRKDPESDTTKDLEAQLEVLKHLSYDQPANSALMTKLKKDRTLSADPSIQAISVELSSNLVPPGAPGTPVAKVQSRILSSKVLASEVMSITETLRTFLHASMGSEDIEEATDNPHVSPKISERRTGIGCSKNALSSKDSVTSPPDEGSDGGYEDTSGDEAIAKLDDGWESSTVGAPSESESSVAGSADDRDWSSDSDDSNGMTFSQGGFGEGDFSSETPKSKKLKPHGPKNQSEFLPSLAVGFARGGSGSEFSDSETKPVGGIKKNRRGQRARRAIWEKKFGKNANHIKRRHQEEEMVHQSKRRLPGSVRIDRRSGNGTGNSSSRLHGTRGLEQVRRKNAAHSERVRRKGEPRETQGEGALHPSWEAKRKQRTASVVPPQGTKIVFA